MIKTFFRLSSFNSQNPSPYHPDNKLERVKMCFASLVAAGAEDITILADTAEEWYPYFEGYEWSNCTNFGNFGTYREQLRLAEKYDKVLLCEDDYLWRTGVFSQAEQFLDVENLLFPYTHPGHFTEGRFNVPWKLKLHQNHTYREVPSNTLTFFTKGQFIHDNIEVFAGHGVLDHELFTALRERSPIWSPCYALATHLVENLLSPDVDWSEFAKISS